MRNEVIYMNEYTVNEKKGTLPVITLSNDLLLPLNKKEAELSGSSYLSAIASAAEHDGYVFVGVERGGHGTSSPLRLNSVGTVAKIVKCDSVSEDSMNVTLEGLVRAQIKSVNNGKLFSTADITAVYTRLFCTDVEYLHREMQSLFSECTKYMPKLPKEVTDRVASAADIGDLTDIVCGILMGRFEDLIDILEEFDPKRRAEILVYKLSRDMRILRDELDIHQKVKQRLDENQRNYYMREQLKVLQDELGEEDSPDEEIVEYMERIAKASLPAQVEERLIKETNKLAKMPYASAESTVIRGYLDVCLELPWNKRSNDRLDIRAARKILDKEHWGLDDVKNRVLEYLAVRKLTDAAKSQIICLVGAPGVGKTSIAYSVAHAMNRKFVRVALGGVRDESDIRGHRKTYIGSMPGRIMNALSEAGVKNPVILLDEIDKLASDMRGDPSSALLEVLDPDQNKTFRDHFVELPFDLSECMFIATANTLDTIARPLLDRMEVIELKTYTRSEKLEIAKGYLIPKAIEKNGLKKRYLKIKDDAVFEIIDHYTREAGVRNLERELSAVCRKIAARQVEAQENALKASGEAAGNASKEQEKEKDGGSRASASVKNTVLTVTAGNVKDYLGPRKILSDPVLTEDEVGVVNGLAYTEVGGELLRVEAVTMKGSGKLELTGSLGDVMKESGKIAYSLARTLSGRYPIPEDFYKTTDIHVHFPEGAVPKDGPSAGVTLITTLVSALSGCPARHDIAMTGEVTLSGRVLAIGGLREKTMAAYKNGIRKVLIPFDNCPDIDRMEDYIKKDMEFVPCKTIYDVLDVAIIKNNKNTDADVVRHTGNAPMPIEMNDINIKRGGNETGYRANNA